MCFWYSVGSGKGDAGVRRGASHSRQHTHATRFLAGMEEVGVLAANGGCLGEDFCILTEDLDVVEEGLGRYRVGGGWPD
jgi:hypothetical protein